MLGMNNDTKAALAAGGIADITTIGRRSGAERRIEIYFHQFDGDYFITGKPGFKRDWMANLHANPEFVLHLKRGVTADVPVVATPIEDPQERADVIFRILTEGWGGDADEVRSGLDRWIEGAPLIRFSPA